MRSTYCGKVPNSSPSTYMHVTSVYNRENLSITHSTTFLQIYCNCFIKSLFSQVCFMHASWRLTEQDGQVGLADLALRNFV